MKILHIGNLDKFLPPFIELVKEEFDFEQHEFLLTGLGKEAHYIESYDNVHVSNLGKAGALTFVAQAWFKMHQADKIILHGLFNERIVQLLFLSPWLLKKCYWVIWGGDLYQHKSSTRSTKWYLNEFFRRPVIRKMGYLVTYVPGDVELAREWYGAKGHYQECLIYPSNVYKDYQVIEQQPAKISIQVGNSADPNNYHLEALEKLLPFKDENIVVYVPLSYGDKTYARKVALRGREWFGDKFVALTEFMPYDEYLQFLSTIDIAIFNHRRQQAMGNTITLLGLGKTVYIRRDTTQWTLFSDKQIKVGDIDLLSNLDLLDVSENKFRVTQYFSRQRIVDQLAEVFGYGVLN